MSEEKGFYGRNISTQMRKELTWQAVYLLDFFEGIWRTPKARVSVTNKRLADEFGFSVRTVGNALKLLEQLGYIRRVIESRYEREILPGGLASRCQGVGTQVQRGLAPTCNNKTYKDKTYKHKPPKVDPKARAFFAVNPYDSKREDKPSTFLTKKQLRNLYAAFGGKGPAAKAELHFWFRAMHEWMTDNHKSWVGKSDHSRAIQRLRRDRYTSKGLKFSVVGPDGPGYYYPSVLKSFFNA